MSYKLTYFFCFHDINLKDKNTIYWEFISHSISLSDLRLKILEKRSLKSPLLYLNMV